MKLNKILPIASIAGVAAIVTPLVTSCGGAKTYSYVFNSTNPAEKWTPKNTTGKHEPWVVADAEGALDLFLDEANKNKEILADNIVYSTLQYLIQDPDDIPDYGSADITIHKIDKKEKRLSFDYKMGISISSEKSNEMISYDFDIKIASMPFVMGVNPEAKVGDVWIFEPKVMAIYEWYKHQTDQMEESSLPPIVLSYLLSDNKWSCSFNIASRVGGLQDKEMYVEYNSRSSTYDLTTMVEAVINGLDWLRFDNLYYLQDVIPQEELK